MFPILYWRCSKTLICFQHLWVWVSGRELTSLACVFLLHLLPGVFGWVGLEPRLTYYFSRPFTALVPVDFFLPWEAGTKENLEGEGWTCTTLPQMTCLVHAVHRACTLVRMNAAEPDDTDEPDLCMQICSMFVGLFWLSFARCWWHRPAKLMEMFDASKIYHERDYTTRDFLHTFLC